MSLYKQPQFCDSMSWCRLLICEFSNLRSVEFTREKECNENIYVAANLSFLTTPRKLNNHTNQSTLPKQSNHASSQNTSESSLQVRFCSLNFSFRCTWSWDPHLGTSHPVFETWNSTFQVFRQQSRPDLCRPGQTTVRCPWKAPVWCFRGVRRILQQRFQRSTWRDNDTSQGRHTTLRRLYWMVISRKCLRIRCWRGVSRYRLFRRPLRLCRQVQLPRLAECYHGLYSRWLRRGRRAGRCYRHRDHIRKDSSHSLYDANPNILCRLHSL